MFRHLSIAAVALVLPALAAEVSLAGAPGFFWCGADTLWTVLDRKGSWDALPRDAKGYGQKVFLWSRIYDTQREAVPDLIVTGRRLDGNSASFIGENPTNAGFADGTEAMLVGANIPKIGCWEITSRYRGYTLTFVVAATTVTRASLK